jgi:hypothetical protein
MAYAVSLLFNPEITTAISARWQRLADVGLSRSMLELGYVPHVTLAVFDRLDVNAATASLDAVFKDAAPLEVTLGGITTFGAGSGVCYAALAPSVELSRLHAAVLGRARRDMPAALPGGALDAALYAGSEPVGCPDGSRHGFAG